MSASTGRSACPSWALPVSGLPVLHLPAGAQGVGWAPPVPAAPWLCVLQAAAVRGARLVLAVGARMG